jgi:hypothetical protein
MEFGVVTVRLDDVIVSAMHSCEGAEVTASCLQGPPRASDYAKLWRRRLWMLRCWRSSSRAACSATGSSVSSTACSFRARSAASLPPAARSCTRLASTRPSRWSRSATPRRPCRLLPAP